MKFGPVPPDEAQGALLAHSLRVSGSTIRKGRALGAEDVRALCRAGIERVTIVRPEEGDLDENRAAASVAARLAGAGIACAAPVNGRVKMYALESGLAAIDARRVCEVNAAGESVALATLAPLTRVERGQVLATLKVLPLALSKEEIDVLAPHLLPSVSVSAFRPLRVGFLQSRVEGTKDSLLEKAVAGTKTRVESLGGSLLATRCCEHDEAAIAEAISDLQRLGLDLLLVIGASATMDRRDCVPRGIEAVGGEVERLGMPVDPGHLTLLARCGDLPVLVAPGSARSLRRSSFDLLLERFAARVPVDSGSVAALGVGGLEKVLHAAPHGARGARHTRPVAALVLGAGQSRRMGPVNKLLAMVDGAPMLARVVGEALESSACAVYVVTGYERTHVEEVLAGRDVRLVHNPGFERGISTSIAAGLSSLPVDVEGALICLGDMPAVSAEVLDRIIAAFEPGQGAEVCVPTYRGKRGNPVLWSRRFFAEICRIRGDAGARHLIGEHSEVVREVPIDDASILLDVDSPEALARVSVREGTEPMPVSEDSRVPDEDFASP